MSALLASKAARRKGAAYVALLVVSLIFLTISSNPFVRDVQHGIAFAFRPIQQAVKTGLIPTINAMMVVGIVSLPGMMTGQLLAGTSPVERERKPGGSDWRGDRLFDHIDEDKPAAVVAPPVVPVQRPAELKA